MNYPVKINLGHSLFNKEQQIEELGKKNMLLENQLLALNREAEELRARFSQACRELKQKDSAISMMDLELAQLKMNHASLETKHQKDLVVARQLETNKEGNVAKIEALMAENQVLKERQVFLESENSRYAKDVKVMTARVDKALKQALELQETLAKKETDILTLEKLMKQKNNQIEILLRKDKGQKAELKDSLIKQACTQLENKIEEEFSLDKQLTQKLQTEIDSLKRKLKHASTDHDLLAKENTKLKEDNFYLVTRLKNLKK